MTGARNTRHLSAVSLPDVLDDFHQKRVPCSIRHTSDRSDRCAFQKEAPPKLGGQGGAEFVSLGGNCRYMTTGIGTVALPPGRVTAARSGSGATGGRVGGPYCSDLRRSAMPAPLTLRHAGSWLTLRLLPRLGPFKSGMDGIRGRSASRVISAAQSPKPKRRCHPRAGPVERQLQIAEGQIATGLGYPLASANFRRLPC